MSAGVPHPAPTPVRQRWQSQPRWTILDTGFATGLRFLEIWQCWRTEPEAPRMLHYVGLLSAEEATGLVGALRLHRNALADQLAVLCYSLTPGFHRLLLEHGQVSLTLCAGDVQTLLTQQQLQADCVLASTPHPWDKWALKALTRCCRRGTRVVFHPTKPAPELLQDAGFQLTPDEGVQMQEAVYDPRWHLRASRSHSPIPRLVPRNPGRCAVVGAGIAGASVARALAVRGWQVDVYDAQPAPAGAAAGLPVGLVVPHHSADDSPRSRMSRAGTRLMLQHACELLNAGADWQPGGVLELAIADAGLAEVEAEVRSRSLPALPPSGWTRRSQWDGVPGLWHPHAAWIKPARLVRQWLEHPGIAFHGACPVHALQRSGSQWQLNNADGQAMGRADLVVFANAHAVAELVGRLASNPPADVAWLRNVFEKLQALQAIPGTVSMGHMPQQGLDADGTRGDTHFPAFPVNGHGSLVSGVPSAQGLQWFAGSTFQTDAQQHANLPHEHATNLHKLQTLLPAAAKLLQPQFANGQVQAWQGTRCVSHDRLPLVGPLEAGPAPSLWVSVGMGARGLSFSALCAELLAAWLGAEPLPIERNLAAALDVGRPMRKKARPLPRPIGERP